MGLYDRDYERENQPWRPEGEGIQLRLPQSVVGRLILINAVVYILQLATRGAIEPYLSLWSDWYMQPWRFFELLTYGFLHSPDNAFHILLNMYSLWLFGSDLERRFGSREFLLFYLTAIVAGGLAYTVGGLFEPGSSVVLGASGGTVAVTILFALLFPHRTILFMFFLPMPVWVLGMIIVVGDIMNATNLQNGSMVASTAHLGGAAFALLYHTYRWRLSNFAPERLAMPSFERKPKLRVHREDDDMPDEDPLEKQLDDILAKINSRGMDSLTRKEKRILEEASRRKQQGRG